MFVSSFSIGKKNVGSRCPVYFIADIAANHDGDLGRAIELIHLAKEAGADCAKFQHFEASKIVSDFGFKHLQTIKTHQSTWKKSVYEIYDDFHCKREWTETLVAECKKVDIEFMTTPYDTDAVDLLDDYVDAYKIGSGDITWLSFLEFLAKKQKPILLATGASSMDEVDRALSSIVQYNNKLVLMQCNTNYTANLDNFRYINLNVLKNYGNNYPGIILGLSDHTKGCSTVLGAVALGAKVIEKHFTDDCSRSGPDHKFAMNPETWKEMVERTRELELALGSGRKKIEDNEKETVIVQRRSIRVKRPIKKGDIILPGDLEELRPCPKDAFPLYRIRELYGKEALEDIEKGDYIKLGGINV